MSEWVLALDVGGTKTLVGAVDRQGNIRAEWHRSTRGDDDEVNAAITFAAASARTEPLAPLAVAAGFPEFVTPDGTLSSREVLSWTTQPATTMPTAFQLEPQRCVVESDVRLGALGEAVYGAGQRAPSFLYLSVGTGLSSAFVIDDTVWAGSRGEAIAIGEWPTVSSELTLEQFCSGAALQSRYAQATGVPRSAQELVVRAGTDPVAADVLETAGHALGIALAAAAQLLDPHAIVLGGGLGSAQTPLSRTAEWTYRNLTGKRPNPAPVIAAQCGHRSGLLGAAVAAWRTV